MRKHEEHLRIAGQAIDWLEELDTAGTARRAAFSAWLKESPRHVGEVLAVSAVCREFAGKDMSHLLGEGASNAASTNVVPFGMAAAADKGGKRWLAAAAGLAGIAVAAAGLLFAVFGGERYSTDIGGRQEIALSDGSVVELNTQSSIRVRFSGQAREIELISGEAVFEVARDPARPFRVKAGSARVEALGTQFNVYRHDEGAVIGVLDGAVRIQDQQVLRPGEQATLTPEGAIASVSTVGPENIATWREGRLVFMDTRLADIVAEFNRYNRKPQLRVHGVATGKRLTGVFDANAPYSFVRFLEKTSRMQVDRNGEDILIRERRATR